MVQFKCPKIACSSVSIGSVCWKLKKKIKKCKDKCCDKHNSCVEDKTSIKVNIMQGDNLNVDYSLAAKQTTREILVFFGTYSVESKECETVELKAVATSGSCVYPIQNGKYKVNIEEGSNTIPFSFVFSAKDIENLINRDDENCEIEFSLSLYRKCDGKNRKIKNTTASVSMKCCEIPISPITAWCITDEIPGVEDPVRVPVDGSGISEILATYPASEENCANPIQNTAVMYAGECGLENGEPVATSNSTVIALNCQAPYIDGFLKGSQYVFVVRVDALDYRKQFGYSITAEEVVIASGVFFLGPGCNLKKKFCVSATGADSTPTFTLTYTDDTFYYSRCTPNNVEQGENVTEVEFTPNVGDQQ